MSELREKHSPAHRWRLRASTRMGTLLRSALCKSEAPVSIKSKVGESRLTKALSAPAQVTEAELRPLCDLILERCRAAEQLHQGTLCHIDQDVRSELHRDGLTDAACSRTFGLLGVLAKLGLGLKPDSVQFIAARMLLAGSLVEMRAGEGKTLAIALAACTAGLTRTPVHVLAANDHLARQGARLIRPLARVLGLKVGVVSATTDIDARRTAYECEIVYSTSAQISKDACSAETLGDGSLGRHGNSMEDTNPTTLGAAVLSGIKRCLALVDDADTVLPDMAASPETFQGYPRMGGATSDLDAVARTLPETFGLHTTTLSSHRPIQRENWAPLYFASGSDKWAAVVASARDVSTSGRPVLIGTYTGRESQCLSSLLWSAGVEHQVLCARNDALEAKQISNAGVAGRITIVTGMAGRGTDIASRAAVIARGGLHVILAETGQTPCSERQVTDRCARRGRPGSFQAMRSIDDAVTRTYWSDTCRHGLRAAASSNGQLPSWLAAPVIRLAQAGTHRATASETAINAVGVEAARSA